MRSDLFVFFPLPLEIHAAIGSALYHRPPASVCLHIAEHLQRTQTASAAGEGSRGGAAQTGCTVQGRSQVNTGLVATAWWEPAPVDRVFCKSGLRCIEQTLWGPRSGIALGEPHY